MLVKSFLRLVYSRIWIAAVILTRWILTVSHCVIIVATMLTVCRCQMWIRCIIVNRPIAAMCHWIVGVCWLPIDIRLLGHQCAARISSCHLHLPNWVLRIYAAAIVWIWITIVHVTDVRPYENRRNKKKKQNLINLKVVKAMSSRQTKMEFIILEKGNKCCETVNQIKRKKSKKKKLGCDWHRDSERRAQANEGWGFFFSVARFHRSSPVMRQTRLECYVPE